MRRVKARLSAETPGPFPRYLSVVRAAAFALVVSLVTAALPGGRAEASTQDLVRQLDGLVSGFAGGTGVWVSDPSSPTPLFTHAPDEQVITASLYKLGVLAEAERRVDSGELHYNDPVLIAPEDVTSDGSFEEAGTSLTLDEALESMITISDNGAALALWHILGGSNIDVTLTKAGMADFHVAYDDSEDNWATPRALGTFFTLLAKRQLISAAASDRMLARLERQQINNRLPAQLPPDVLIAHKTGNLPGLTHDAGIIFTKAGPRVVVAMTWDALDEDADNFISSVGALVYGAILEPSANARYQVSKTGFTQAESVNGAPERSSASPSRSRTPARGPGPRPGWDRWGSSGSSAIRRASSWPTRQSRRPSRRSRRTRHRAWASTCGCRRSPARTR